MIEINHYWCIFQFYWYSTKEQSYVHEGIILGASSTIQDGLKQDLCFEF